MVLTIDNCKASVLFNDKLLDLFNFAMFQMDTYEEYSTEVEYQPNLFSQKNDNQEIGLNFIFQSMTET